LADDADPSGIGSIARQCVAGIVNDHVSMTALVAPTVNAY
jgi:glutamine synthetase